MNEFRNVVHLSAEDLMETPVANFYLGPDLQLCWQDLKVAPTSILTLT